MKTTNKKVIFSGVQPSGNLHIGNYLGAIIQWLNMQKLYNCIFCVVDYHAITVKQEPKELKNKILEVAKVYLASGIDPKKSVIFQQSDITAHTELCWILNCVARVGEMGRMTQFKEKAEDHQESSSVGLFDYPVLMAADILLYNTDFVPVGEDQVQHVELARTLARRFNSQFGEVFKIPEVTIKEESARIMGLDDPSKKMSKSASSIYNYIALTDKPEEAVKKILKAVTDSGKDIIYHPENKPAISNLLVIYSLLANVPIKDLEKKYQDKGYGDFKKDLALVIEKFLIKFQKKYYAISDDEVRKVLDSGAKKIRPIAEETLRKVKEKIGII
jgi:tryptophanyl-tRNA synthetase